MAYQPTFWVNNAEPAITAEKLNKIEQGISTSAAVADSKASTDYVNDAISAEVTNRINYVDNQVNTLSDTTDVKIGQVRLDIEQALQDPDSVIAINVQDILNTSVVDPDNTTVNSYIKSTAVSAVDTEWSLNALTTNIASQFGENASNIEQGVLTLADNEWSLNTLTTNINSKFGVNASSIDEAITTSVNDEFALSTMKTNLESAFGPNISNINTKLSTYATNEDVGAIAQVQLDVNGRITGWTAVDGSLYGSAFRINADTFSIADGANEHAPLSIDATTGISQFNGILNVYNNTTGSYYKVADKFDDIQTQLDGKVESWFYAYPPSNTKLPTSSWIANGTRNLHINDMFYDTTNKRLYRYTSGFTWEEVVNADAIAASEAAANAEAAVDGKITTFSSTTTPTAEAIGDLWIHPTTNIMKRWSGSSWTTIDVATAFNNGNTTIDGGKITTGTITADKILINSDAVDALNVVGGIQANSIYGNIIEGITIKGAYIEGSVIKASYIDLDGELQIFTSWAGVANSTYQANPSAYPDLAYDTGTGYWRTPTLSVVRESTASQSIVNSGNVFNSKIKSYNSYNVGHNIKARLSTGNILKADNYTEFIILSGSSTDASDFISPNWNSTDVFRVSVGNSSVTFQASAIWVYTNDDAGYHISWKSRLKINGSLVYDSSLWDKATPSYTINVNGVQLNISMSIGQRINYKTYIAYTVKIINTDQTTIGAFTDNAKSLIKIENLGGEVTYNSQGTGKTAVANMSSKYYIDNIA